MGLFDSIMSIDLEKVGKQLTDFISSAQTTLGAIHADISACKAELAVLRSEHASLHEKHAAIMGWIATLDEEELREVAEGVEAAAAAAAASAEAAAAAGVAAEGAGEAAAAAADAVTEEDEEGEEIPAEEEGALPETPIPGEETAAPAKPAAERKRKFLSL